MVVYDDWDGFYFTIQAIRMYHAEVIDDIHFVVINTNPSSSQGLEISGFCKRAWAKKCVTYYADDNESGCFTKGKIFSLAESPYVLVIDPHVLVSAGSIKKLIDYYDNGLDGGNLLQGPLEYDSLNGSGPSCFERIWSGGMLGKWKFDERSLKDEPFEIHAQGMGLFSCRKDSWLGFPEGNSGFGGEEVVIHDKYRKFGKKTICLPWLKWLHRFGRPSGVPYPNQYENRVKNYYRGFIENGQPTDEIIDHFKTIGLSEETLKKWLQDVTNSDV